jgi:hypothetical protein
MIAKKLDTKIRDAILTASRSTTGTGLFAQDSSGLGALQRPGTLLIAYIPNIILGFSILMLMRCLVLLILDRNIDLVPMLSHGWTYQALVHDCLDMKLNRVVVVGIFHGL